MTAGADVTLTDVSSELGVASIIGPAARAIISGATETCMSNGLWINLKFCRVTVEHDW